MLKVLKRMMGAVAFVGVLVFGGMMAMADETQANPPAEHVCVSYEVFTNGAWTQTAEDGQPAAEGSYSKVEGIRARLKGVEGSISYRVFLTEGGWQTWVSDGATAGGEGTGGQVEAIQMKLSGYAAQVLDVWYSTTISGYDKLGWAREGAAGVVGAAKPMTSFSAYLSILHQNVGGGAALRTSLPYGFYTEDGVLHYTDAPGAAYSGWADLDGARYYARDNALVTGWQYIDGLKFYFDEQGKLVQDLDSLIGIQSSYVIRVNKELNTFTPYAKDGDNGYIIPVKTMLCSVGDDTPLGTFHTPEKYRWRLMVNDTYTQYATRITAGQGFLIHSICYDKPDIYTMQSVGYNGLGVVRSLGCIRLTTVNAKWVYDNCPIGTAIEIYEDPASPGPYYKPTVTPIPVEQTWDPTDPSVSDEVRAEAAKKQVETAAESQETTAAEESKASQAEETQGAVEETTKGYGPGFR